MKPGDIILRKIDKVFASSIICENEQYFLRGIAFTNFRDVMTLKNILNERVVLQCIKVKKCPIVELWRPWANFDAMTYDEKIIHMSRHVSINSLVLQSISSPIPPHLHYCSKS